MKDLTETTIAEALRELGVEPGTTVFVHSSLAAMGRVQGGSEAVVAAFQRVLGPRGTLAAPTFTFSHGKQDDPIFDPAADPSEVGAISETLRVRAGARRSRHLVHSVAAYGYRSQDITAVQGASAWAGDGPFWQLYWLDAHIVLIGVPYLRCTFFHIIEQLLQVPYRRWTDKTARMRNGDGSLVALPTLGYGPESGFRGNDFNKLGIVLEDEGLSRVKAVGNAVCRLFRAKDAMRVGVREYRRDPMLFVRTGEKPRVLSEGVTIGELNREKCVYDPTAVYSRR